MSVSEIVAPKQQLARDTRLAKLRCLAILPAFNEERCIGKVIEEIRAFDPGFEVVVVDDGSTDRTATVAAEHGARVLRLPINLGIGGAVQTGYLFALESGFDIAVQIDGDGQHDPRELPAILAPVLDGNADICVGSRFAGGGTYRSPFIRRLGIRAFARVVSLLVGQALTDTSSSFRALNKRTLRLFAQDYPHGYLETVEATVMAVRYGLRVVEVPVAMRTRAAGESTLTLPLSVFYGFKVLVAVFVGLFRRPSVHMKEIP